MAGWEGVTEATKAVADPVVTLLNRAVEFIPGFIGAILLTVLGYIVSTFVGLLIKKGLLKAGLDKWVESTGRHPALGEMSISRLLGGMVKWYLFSLFLFQSFSLVSLTELSNVLTTFALFIPNILIAVIVVIVGIILADVAYEKLAHAHKITWVRALSPFAKFIIIVLFVDVALKQVGIRFALAEYTYLIIIGAIALAAAIAIGIPLGYALKPQFESLVKDIKKKIK